MLKTHLETARLRSCDCDMHGLWRPGAVLECMQETAGTHSALLGLDRSTMNGMNLAWVLSRTKVQLLKTPRAGDLLSIETFPMPQKHMFFPRTHIFRGKDGGMIGAANSLWVLIDISTRKVTASPAVSEKMPDNHDLQSPLGLPATVRALPADDVTECTILPQFTDFDTNHHVNNTKYLDWCVNALGMDTMRERFIAEFDVNYIAEILPDSEVRTQLARNDDRFSFLGFKDAAPLFAISGRLKKRL